MKSKISSLIPVIFIMLAIFMFSAQNSDDSGSLSRKIVDLIFFWKKDDITPSGADHIVRKLAHFTIYTTLGCFTMFHLKNYNLSWLKSTSMTVLFCLLYASTDEIHQLFIEGRSGQISDVMLDTAGAFFGTLIFSVSAYIIRKKERETS